MRTLVVLFGLLSVVVSTEARAEWYLAADLLQARYAGPNVDGPWVPKNLPAGNGIPAAKESTDSLAWDAGVGYRFAGGESWLTTLWSIEGGYRDWGSVTAGRVDVSDYLYGPIMRHKDDLPKVNKSDYEATDHLQGGYLRVAKGFDAGYGIEPYLSGGVFVAHADRVVSSRSSTGQMGSVGSTGVVAGPTVGGGIKYDMYRGIKARAGAESHWAITESGHPISSQWLTVGGGIEVPLAGWW